MTTPCTHAHVPARPPQPPPTPGALLSVDEVRHLHPDMECHAWQTIVELVEMGVVEAHADRAGLVRLYPVEVPA